jgi:tripeptide aminopeptidase
MGNLRGMRAVFERFGPQARYIVVEGGSLGQIIHKAIGVKRFRIAIRTPGGHSWGSFGEPSAIHELGNLIAEISRIRVPDSPKTTYNVGVIEGGTTVNSIASSASMLLDLRSEEKGVLDQLVTQIKTIVKARQWQAKNNGRNVIFDLEEVGSRPPGSISHKDILVCLAEEALHHVGWPSVTNNSGSTDANIPISQNISGICVGVTTSGNSHRLDEYIDLVHLGAGMQQLLLLTLAAANY